MGHHPPHTLTLETGEACVVRTAEAHDAAGLLAVTRETLAEEGSEANVTLREEFTVTEEQELAWIEEHRRRDGWLVLVAEVGGEVVGALDFKNGLRRRIAHRGVFGMNVRPGMRGRGVGDALLGGLLAWARAHPGVEKVSLAVIEGNTPAISLYRKHGFVEEGRRPRELRLGTGRYADDILMYRFV